MATPVEVNTDANGNFDLELDPGNWNITVTLPGYTSPPGVPVTLADGETKDIGTLVLTKIPGKGHAKGNVKDNKGVVVPGAKVTATPK